MPFRAARHEGRMVVDWFLPGALRPVDPFFQDTVARAFRSPFNLAFWRRTPIEALAALPPGLGPSGFVFHMSRCGSTLCAQALARDPSNIVLSEPGPVSAALRAPLSGPASDGDVAAWLRGLINALAQPRFPGERRCFVKFVASDVLYLPAVRRAFPGVPWIFVYRDPGEVLASHRARMAPELFPGHIDPRLLGLELEEVCGLAFEDYGARCLAAFAGAALREEGGLVLHHDDLAAGSAAWGAVLDHFGLHDGREAALEPLLGRHAKSPDRPYVDDRAAKRAAAAAWRPAVDRIAGPALAALDERRLAARRGAAAAKAPLRLHPAAGRGVGGG